MTSRFLAGQKMGKVRFMKAACYAVLCQLTLISTATAGPIGIQSLPEDLPKTTIFIEKKTISLETKKIPASPKDSVDLSIFPAGAKAEGTFTRVTYYEEQYRSVGSAVLVSSGGFLFAVTAKHVVENDPDVYFNIPQASGLPKHLGYKDLSALTGLGWQLHPTHDVALTLIAYQGSDAIKSVPLGSYTAKYDEIKIGEDVFILGYPSSVVSTSAGHIVRSGIISAKPGDLIFLVDASVFPGNSGGPVFWKPSTEMTFGAGLQGPPIPGRVSKLLGIGMHPV